ncbi:MAG: ATP-dependent zinc metalloprotease FtsH [Erysipelotrichaceae bacterium]|nr:ATP-dependent zinc metalloprotease FtsH [Erysipelotrichaceae bacterium]
MKKRKVKISHYLPYLMVISLIVAMFFNNPYNNNTTVMTYDTFNKTLENKAIKEANVSVSKNIISISGKYTKDGKEANFKTVIPNNSIKVNEILGKLTASKVLVSDADQRNVFLDVLVNLLPIILMLGMGFYLFKSFNANGGNRQAFEFGESKARLEGNIKVRFADIAGCDEEKEEMTELIEYLRSPKKFAQMGARIPKGVLMVGNPGTGKTLLAKAVAGEANVPFYSISGSDFVEMFVGVGASRVRKMFQKAKENVPCIIFIDEIDAVGRQRGAGLGGGHDEREQTLNQMLVEMDGIGDNTGIVIIAATNRPDVLDPALLRPGRFDRQITVSLPDKRGREAILKVHARNKNIHESVDLTALANRTPGFSGADLENVLNEAAILAVRDHKTIIETPHIDEAIDRVMMGPAKKSRKYDEKTKKLVAYHESGHAIVGLNLEHGTIVQKVTIIPRGQAGGYNLMTPKDEKMLNTKNDLKETIISYMGGRVAEELFFDDVTTGAINDFENATRIARDMVTLYGMSDLGPIQYDHGSHNVFLGRDYTQGSNVSGQVAFEIDQEVRKIINECYGKAKEIISAHRDDLIRIAEALMNVETLTAEEIKGLYDKKMQLVDDRILTNEEVEAMTNQKTEMIEVETNNDEDIKA